GGDGDVLAVNALAALPLFIARAGGGHSFGGGGGGSRSSGGSGGGGSGVFFFGGGGGGGGGAIGLVVLIVVVLVLLAAFVAIRRGRATSSAVDGATRGYGGSTPPWTGSDAPAINSVRGGLFPGTGDQAHPGAASAASSVDDGLAQISAHDPAFNKEAFLEQVQRSFFVVQEAWTERKPEMSRQVMADGLWQQHKVQIDQYVAEHKRNVLEDLAVGNVSVGSAHSDDTYDTITVRLLAACADYDVDDQSGKVVRGNRRVDQWQEDWTFQRSSKAVTKPGGGTLSSKCPNCGAPLNVDLQGVCPYCHQPVMSGQYDWVLARIGQVT
ncbi:MAG TPA: TIM44-like domain-containing protein, partial [Acidimicrobiales bacterium]|nr:TIM44-like domain-containing protein [Acidimicrobiales bacterium]